VWPICEGFWCKRFRFKVDFKLIKMIIFEKLSFWKKVKDTVKVQVGFRLWILWLNACLKLFQWITVAFKAGECLEFSEPPADPEENWWCSLLSMVSSKNCFRIFIFCFFISLIRSVLLSWVFLASMRFHSGFEPGPK